MYNMKKTLFAAYALLVFSGEKAAVLRAQDVLPLSIEDLFRQAETSNHGMQVFRMAEEEAAQAVKVSRNALLPTITGEASASYLGNARLWERDFTGSTSAPMPHFGNNFALEAVQTLYTGGRISSDISIAKLRQRSAQIAREDNRQSLRFLLAGNYLELSKLQNQEKVYLQNIGQTIRLIEEIEAKHTQGVVLKNDVTRYELQLKGLQLGLTQLRNSMDILNHQLVVALGLPEQTIIGVDTTLAEGLPPLSDEAGWLALAMQSAPALQQSQTEVDIARQQEKAVRAERIPDLSVFAGDHLDGPITIEVPPLDQNLNYWYVGIGLKYDFSSLFKSNKKARQARIATQKAAEEHLARQDELRTDVKEAYVRFVEAFTIYDTQLKSLQLAQQSHAVVNNRYLNGLALVTDMLDADNAKLDAELQVVNARINILFNYYKLKKTTGTL